MAYKVRCTHCGKSMLLPEGDAGLGVVCLACGTKFVAPPQEGLAVPPPPPAPVMSAPQTEYVPELMPAASPPPQQQREARPELLRVPWPLIGIACAVLLIVAGMGWKIDRWWSARSGAQALQHMMSDARDLAATGDMQGAYQKYREADRLAITLGSDDAHVRELADEVRAEQEKMFGVLLAGRPPKPNAPPLPAPPTTSAPVAAKIESHGEYPATSPAFSPATTRTTQPSEIPEDNPAPLTTRPVPRRPPLHPIPERITGISDEEIGAAIQKGADRLIDLFNPVTGQLRQVQNAPDEGYACGLNALCVYALLQSGQAIPDQRLNVRGPFMKLLMNGMKRLPANSGMVTYARGIRATALALYNRTEDRSALRADVQYLLLTHTEGAYSYAGVRPTPGSPVRGSGSWDNSNSQYGLLGVWSGAEVGAEVPASYWAAVQKHWNVSQIPDGMWAYGMSGPGGGTLSMTSAGTASLFVAEDYLYSMRFGARVGREPFSPQLKKALDWWESNGGLSLSGSSWWGYTLYGVERVGLASGFKYFGRHDWYRELAAEVVARQQPDGTWGDVVDSAYALLFLSRGRHPILMNKLRFEKSEGTGNIPGYWGNRPRDAANLARYAGRKLERQLNWQIVTLDRDWHDWLDSPILSIASHRAPLFTEAHYDKLRQYVEAGGMLFLQADGDSPEFDAFAQKLARRLFPQYEMTDLSSDHVLYNAVYKVDPPPPLKVVTNGVRVLILYSPKDITRAWQMRDEKARGNVFQLGVNLFVYAAGKRELRNRLSSPYISPVLEKTPGGTFHVARVQYNGAWDPEPGAWRRFGNWFARQTGAGLSIDTVPLKKLDPAATHFAHLTGTAAYLPTDDEMAAIRAYVNAGGLLFIDACGTSRPFAEQMRAALTQAFPEQTLEHLPRRHPLLEPGAPGMDDLRKPRLRLFSTEIAGAASSSLEILKSGTGAVIFSNLDVTSGLLGTQTWGIEGYDPSYAQSLMKNLIFWTIDGQPGTD